MKVMVLLVLATFVGILSQQWETKTITRTQALLLVLSALTAIGIAAAAAFRGFV